MAYTKDGIMAQIYVAFGQGTGTVRVSHDAAVELHSRYYNMITTEVINNWDKEGVQVLERIRAIGRLMAHETIQSGATAILGAGAVNTAASTVELKSQTTLCGGPPPVATGVV